MNHFFNDQLGSGVCKICKKKLCGKKTIVIIVVIK
jgi:hypothetical protein